MNQCFPFIFALINEPVYFTTVQSQFQHVNVFITIFSGFAFITSFLREIIKDIEDYKGDDRFGCRTFTVVYGLKKAKWLAVLITMIALVAAIWCQVYFFETAYIKLFYYFFSVDILLLIITFMLIKSRKSNDFKTVSFLVKLLMLVGLLSMFMVYLEY